MGSIVNCGYYSLLTTTSTCPNNKRFKSKAWSKEELAGWQHYANSYNDKKIMSIWDNPEMQEGEQDNSGSMFLNKALGDGDSIKLHFVNVQKMEQNENTQYPTDDGMEWVFYFSDEAGKERTMNQRSTKGAFFKAMRAADIQPETDVTVSRKGVGIETEYTITTGGASPQPVEAESAPF